MNRIDRLSAILIQLQSKRIVKAQEIADRFEISLRTVYRDIRALEEGGVPIGAEAGIGYFLDQNYNLPPVMLSKEEAGALVIAGKFLHRLGDQKLQEHHESALMKVKSILKHHEKDYLEDLENSVQIQTSHWRNASELQNNQLSLIQSALPDRHVIFIQYHSFYKDEVTTRALEPIGLSFYNDQWHLIAFCRLRNDYRDFRVDRIREIEIQRETYATINHPDLNTYFRDLAQSYDLHLVKVQFDKMVASYICTTKYQYGWVEEKELEHCIEMTFASADLFYFSRWMMMFGSSATILTPEDLILRVQDLVRELSSHLLK